MKRTILLTLILAGCSGSGLSTSSGPNGETIVGNDVSVPTMVSPLGPLDVLSPLP